jgi:hypothetical protein
MTRFRQALLDELLSRIPDQPSAAPARTRSPARQVKLWLAIGGAAAAVVAATVATVAVVSMTVDQATPIPPATAQPPFVTTEVDGVVTMTGDWRNDPAAANQALRTATNGKVAIIPTSPEADCPVADRGTKAPETAESMRLVRTALLDSEDNELRVRPGDIPDGWVLVLIAGTLPRSTTPVTYVSVYLAPGPACLAGPIPADGPPQ